MNALALITATIEPGSTSLAQQLKAIGFQQMPASRTYANYGHTDSGDYMDTRVGYLRPRVRVWMSRGLRGGPDTVFVCVLGLTVWLGDFQETQAAEIVAAARKALKLYKLIVSERDRVLLYGSEDLVVRLVHHYYPNIAVSTIKKDLCDVKTGGLRGLPRNVAEATVEPQQATVSVAARMLMAVTGHTRVTKASFWEVLEGGPDYVKVYITPHSSDAKLCGGIRVDILGAIELVLKPGDHIATFATSVAKTLARAKEVAASLPLVHDYEDQQKVDFAYHSAGLLFPGKHIPLGSVYKMQKDVHVTATVEPGPAQRALLNTVFLDAVKYLQDHKVLEGHDRLAAHTAALAQYPGQERAALLHHAGALSVTDQGLIYESFAGNRFPKVELRVDRARLKTLLPILVDLDKAMTALELHNTPVPPEAKTQLETFCRARFVIQHTNIGPRLVHVT